ncbi:plasmid mobilization relaxosome protein MobC [Pedobacter polaris]|uniref:Plasmid mobilization relaxosome protein MobC n=1 Tax=Pedobacter polaris TaxID=2571273 RepID=A0A4U1CK59_9SPHI|nr:plasmid mobilization relaxosome protein MobC [Pedobacter polaris]TKC08010.1 plasmid mobilization relaxosome protein MobC [Pedobacter polaris]
MKDLKRLKGRPVLEIGKRNKKIDVRFNEEEFKLIEELEKTLGLTKTEIVRRKALDKSNSIVINAKEAIKALDVIGEELGRSGNNINQLAKYANTLNRQGIYSEVVISRFNVLFENYVETQKSLEVALRKIIRLMGK